MLSFITYKNLPEQLEIIADDEGLQELIDYLKSVKSNKDHLHLTLGSELDPYPIPKDREEIISFAKYVRLEYEDTQE